MTGEIVSAYVSKNAVTLESLPALITDVHGALLRTTKRSVEVEAIELVPAVSVRASVKADHIVCLECGKRFKSIKRHLSTHHALTPAEYREKWNLRSDYPMVARDYAKVRSDLARSMGLGRKNAHAEDAAATAVPAEEVVAPARPKALRKSRAEKVQTG